MRSIAGGVLRQSAAGVVRFRHLLIAQLAVYLAMAALSAVRLDSVVQHPLAPGQWELTPPSFIVRVDADGPPGLDGLMIGVAACAGLAGMVYSCVG